MSFRISLKGDLPRASAEMVPPHLGLLFWTLSGTNFPMFSYALVCLSVYTGMCSLLHENVLVYLFRV